MGGHFACPPIEKLEASAWRGHVLHFNYVSDAYYDLAIRDDTDGIAAALFKKAFEQPFHKVDAKGSPLFAPHWEGAEAYGIRFGKELAAVIQLCPEEWSNRLRATDLWVHQDFRRKGLGTALMRLAKEKAAKQNRRVLILETQSCNAPAIAFYLAQGFRFIGFDLCCYSNQDIAQREVRLEMGYFLQP